MLKYEELEKQIIELRGNTEKRDKMYQLIMDITKDDFDNMDLCRKLLKGKDINKMSENKQAQLLSKIKGIFGRQSSNCDANSSSLLNWIEYIQD